MAVPLTVVYALELAGEDDTIAAAEANSAATNVRLVATGLALAESVMPDRIRRLAFTHRAIAVIESGQGGIDAASAGLEAADLGPQPPGPVAVRARDLRASAGVDTQVAERTLGRVLVNRGFEIDLETPATELRAAFSDGRWVLGWSIAESIRDFGERRPTDRPFFQPGGMSPLLSRAVANLAIGDTCPDDTTLLDPMCGTGGIIVEGGLVGAHVIGMDVQPEMVAGTGKNLTASLEPDRYRLCVADVTSLPLESESIDAVAMDTPYGRQSPVRGRDRSSVIHTALCEANRVGTRAVVVADRDLESMATDAGFSVREIHERQVHRSLTRYVHVLR